MTGQQTPSEPALILDEMFSGALAATLRDQKHDVIAVVEYPAMCAMTDGELFAWAAENGRRIVTENVKDFRPLLLEALERDRPYAPLLLTSSRTFARSRHNPAQLLNSIDKWLIHSEPTRPVEDWLTRS